MINQRPRNLLRSFFLSTGIIIAITTAYLNTAAAETSITTTTENNSTPTFGLNPTSPLKNSGLTFVDVNPGEEADGSMTLGLMTSDVEALFVLEARMATEVTDPKNDPSKWVTFPGNEKPILLKDKTPISIPLKLKVPVGTAPGDYKFSISATMIEYGKSLEKKKEEKKIQANDGSLTIGAKINFASGISAMVRVKGEINLNAYLEDIRYEVGKDGSLKFHIACKNGSSVSIIPTVKIRIYDTLKKKEIFNNSYDLPNSNPKDGCGGEIFIQEKVDNKLTEKPLLLRYGIYETSIDFEYVMLDFLTPRDQLPIHQGGKGQLKIYQLPVQLIMIITSILIIGIVIISYRVYRNKKLLSISKPYMVQNGETLETLSQKFKISPKVIININKIQFPYILTPGRKILIPMSKK